MADPRPSCIALALRDVRVEAADPGAAPRAILDIPEFALPGGGQIAICGPSGSGKTTLLNLLAGIERPLRGIVQWGAVAVSGLPERAADRWRRETVGIVFQQFHLFPGMSALENVLLPLRFDRWSIASPVRGVACALLERVGVRPGADAGALSRGEQQRVAVARALLRRPAIVLADEPTASLDRESANLVADLLFALCREAGATLIVATHDPQLAARTGVVVDIVDGALRTRGAADRRRWLASVA
jgi:putative ABC transport system ATP-binding protein